MDVDAARKAAGLMAPNVMRICAWIMFIAYVMVAFPTRGDLLLVAFSILIVAADRIETRRSN